MSDDEISRLDRFKVEVIREGLPDVVGDFKVTVRDGQIQSITITHPRAITSTIGTTDDLCILNRTDLNRIEEHPNKEVATYLYRTFQKK